MQWVEQAEEFAGQHGWGARGKQIGISRMFHDSDLTVLAHHSFVGALRPRGIISGFLVVVPGSSIAVYLPPIAAKMSPQQIRIRIDTNVSTQGAVFSAYMTRDSTGSKALMIEDILVWGGKSIWYTLPFMERWKTLNEFFTKQFQQDTKLQRCVIRPQTYLSLKSIVEPDEKQVLEFTPNQKGQKRIIWMAVRSVTKPQDEAILAKKEVGAGPDVFILYKGGVRLGQALVRTLAVSKLLRAAFTSSVEEVPVFANFHKQFEKWEIVDVKNTSS